MYNIDILRPLEKEERAALSESGGQGAEFKNLQVIFMKVVFKATRVVSLRREYREREKRVCV